MPTPLLTDTITWGNVLTTTLMDYRPQMIDAALGHIQFLRELLKAGNVEFRSGERIIEPLFTDLFGIGGAIQPGDTFSTTYQQPFARAAYFWKQIVMPIPIRAYDVAVNAGSNQVINIVDALVEAAQRSLHDRLANATEGVQSNNGDNLTGLSGIRALVSKTPAANTVGSIPGTATRNNGTTFWQNHVGTTITAWNTDGIQNIRAAMFRVQRGLDKVNLHVTTSTAVQRLINRLTGSYVYNLPVVVAQPRADTSVADITLDGAPVIHDVYSEADTWRGLNTTYLKLILNREGAFAVRPFVPAQNSLDLVGAIWVVAELITNNRERHFVLSGADSAP
jgi:hypothetical protein